MRIRPLPSLFIFAIVAACSSSADDKKSAAPIVVPPGPTTFTMKVHVEASTETVKCKLVQMPPGDGYVVGAVHSLAKGSHHVVLYSTDMTAIPPGGDQVQECYENGVDMMNHVRGVVYPAATPSGEYDLAPGVGLPYKGGQVLIYQAHYVNPSGDAVDPEVAVHLKTTTDGITQRAGILFFYDPFIDVPAGGKARAGMRCPIRQDVTIASFGSHYHRRGVNFEAYLDPPDGPRATTPFFTSHDWTSPDTDQTTVIPIKAGSHIRYRCDYDNTRGTQAYNQGPRAEDDEMCLFASLYWPALTADDENCVKGDEYGTGQTSCVSSMNCLEACPPGVNDVKMNQYTPCVQRCMQDACPAASAPLQTLIGCVQTSCAAECAPSDAGGPSSACTGCVLEKCGSEYGACSSAPCDPE